MSTAPPPSAAPPKAPAPVTEAVVAAAAAAAAVAAAPVNRSVDFDFRRPDPRKLPNNLGEVVNPNPTPMPPKLQPNPSPLQEGAPFSPRGGCPKGAHLLSTVPQQLIGQKIITYNPQTKVSKVGTIKNFDSIKGEHSVQIDGETLIMLDLSNCYWCLSHNIPEPLRVNLQENNGNKGAGSMEQMELEEEGKGRRKRRPSSRQDQAMADKLGSIQAKGRRPYKPGGCKVGRMMRDEQLVGVRVHMWSLRDSVYYAGGVKDYNPHKRLHTILYLDGTTEAINMKEAIWRVATSEYDDVYPKDFDIKPAVEEVRETRRRKGNSGQIQAVTPTTAAEGLLALASSGSAPSLVAAAMGVMGSPVAGGSDGGGGGGSRDLPYAANGGQGGPGSGFSPNRGAKGGDPSGNPGGTGGAGDGNRSGDPGQQPPNALGGDGSQKLVASSLEFKVHKVENPDKGYHVLCSVPPGTRISDVHVTCGNACIIIEHGRNNVQQSNLQTSSSNPSGCSRLVILLPEPIRPSSASAKLTQGGQLAVFTALASP